MKMMYRVTVLPNKKKMNEKNKRQREKMIRRRNIIESKSHKVRKKVKEDVGKKKSQEKNEKWQKGARAEGRHQAQSE